MTRILIRTDGSFSLGLGHVTRCLSLASMLKEEFNISFYLKDAEVSVSKFVIENGFAVKIISKEQTFFDELDDNEIVVLDGYHFDTEYQKRIKGTGAKLVCIDDLNDKEYYADLIINHSPTVRQEDYRAKVYTSFALGLDYVLLRPPFLRQAKKPRFIKTIENILICFGGSDFQNLTQSTLNVVMGFSEFKNIIVITGPAYRAIDTIRIMAQKDSRIIYDHAVTAEVMLSRMLEADVAIVPASGMLLEALAAGCRIISGMYVANQKFLYLTYRNVNAFIDAGDFSVDKLETAIKKCFYIKREPQKLIDGNSDTRLKNCFLQLRDDSFHLREAGMVDIEITYRWAKDPNIRAYSFNQNQITVDEHISWFKNKLEDKKCVYFIAEFNNKAIGSIRFDIKGGEAVISYLIDPEFQGRGFGQRILKMGLERFIQTADRNVNQLTGYVIKENIASVKAFERIGFAKNEVEGKFEFKKRI